MMGEAIQQGGGHLGITEDACPFAEAEVGGDDEYPSGQGRGRVYLALSRWITISSRKFSIPKSVKAMTPSSLRL